MPTNKDDMNDPQVQINWDELAENAFDLDQQDNFQYQNGSPVNNIHI